MKKQNIILVLLAIIFCIQSCLPSLHPLYTEKDLIFVEDLLGTWGQEDEPHEAGNKLELSSSDGEIWRFEKAGEKEYTLIQVDDQGAEGKFEVRILKLGKYHFMDFMPLNASKKEKVNEFWSYHYVPVHTFAKIELTEEHLIIQMFNPEFLQELLENKKIRIKNEKVGEGYLLTAGTEELQKFVMKYAEEEKAYIEATSLKRKI